MVLYAGDWLQSLSLNFRAATKYGKCGARVGHRRLRVLYVAAAAVSVCVSDFRARPPRLRNRHLTSQIGENKHFLREPGGGEVIGSDA